MKKVTSNVQLEKYAETPAVQYYKGSVSIGNMKSVFLLEVHRGGKYEFLMEEYLHEGVDVIEMHQLPTDFLGMEDEEKKVARIARISLARMMNRANVGGGYIGENMPGEIFLGMEHGLHVKRVVYNLYTDRISKRRV